MTSNFNSSRNYSQFGAIRKVTFGSGSKSENNPRNDSSNIGYGHDANNQSFGTTPMNYNFGSSNFRDQLTNFGAQALSVSRLCCKFDVNIDKKSNCLSTCI